MALRPEVTGKKQPTPGEQVIAAERLTYSVEEAARILGICRTLAYRPGVLPTIRIGGRRVVPKHALEQMLSGN